MAGFDYNKVKDPRFFCENRLEAHSDHAFFASKEEAVSNESSLVYSLNGFWKFSYANNYENSIKDFWHADSPEKDAEDQTANKNGDIVTAPCDCKSWDDIRVPAHMQMEGYGLPQYVNTQYPWDGHENIAPPCSASAAACAASGENAAHEMGAGDVSGAVPERFNPVGSYVKYFTLPPKMNGKRVFISFQGAESGLAVWLNGVYLGYSEDSFTPSEFELTGYLVEGENKLAAQVFRWTSGSWCEDQDFFRFSGIYRDVYLYAVPKVHAQDICVRTLLDDAYQDADLQVLLKTWGSGSVRLRLEEEGTPVAEACATVVCDMESEPKTGVFSVRDSDLELSMHISAPQLWSAEHPKLYMLWIELMDESGEVVEVIRQPVGFRRFEMKDHMMHLNGKRIVFKGVNRHDFSSRYGRAVTYEETEQDIITMKQNNINAIRTSHYPNHSFLYELCDRYGLYMIDEANMETHGTWAAYLQKAVGVDYIVPRDHEEWEGALLDRANSMVQRDKNHPSILIWSCGNESYGGSVIHEMSQLFRRLDSTRLVHYEGIFWDRRYNDTSDMESQMYTPAAKIREFLQKDRSKPFICCEYMHAMGNSCGAMQKYTDMTEEEPLYQGGFIWDYIDQSITKKDRYGNLFEAYGGDFDDRPSDYNFSGNGIAYGGDREASPKMQTVKFHYQNIRVFPSETQVRVKNLSLFTDTAEYECVAFLQRDGQMIREVRMNVSVPPLSEKTFELPFGEYVGTTGQSEANGAAGTDACKVTEAFAEAGEYTVTVSFRLKEDTLWAKRGHEVAFGQYTYGRCQCAKPETSKFAGNPADCCRSAANRIPLAADTAAPLKVVQGRNNIGVRGEHFEALFAENIGLTSYRWGGKELLKSSPQPDFWRALTDNDCGSNTAARLGQWKLASLYASVKNPAPADPDENWHTPMALEVQKDCAKIRYTYWLPTIPRSSCEMEYTVYGDGTVQTRLHYDPVEGLPEMPLFGVSMKLDADYDQIQWYGLGPEETYSDREAGAKLGIYKSTVKESMAKYLVPQECGNKTGVRWAKVTDRRNRGLLFWNGEAAVQVCQALETPPREGSADILPEGRGCYPARAGRSCDGENASRCAAANGVPEVPERNGGFAGRIGQKNAGMEFSAMPYTSHEIENAAHAYELSQVHYTVIRAALAQMGVGGDDSWGAQAHEEYRLPTDQPLDFAFCFRGI